MKRLTTKFFLALVLAALPARALNPGALDIQTLQDFDRVIAISDVHGMYPAMLRLLQGARLIDGQGHWTGGRALLIVVGDSIDKGPQSLDVIDFWMRLPAAMGASGARLLVLLGNHEAEFLADPMNDKAKEFRDELAARHVPLAQLTSAAAPRGAWLRSLPIAARVGRWLFAHAGLYPTMNWPDFTLRASQQLSAGSYESAFVTGPLSILEAKDWWEKPADRRDEIIRLANAGIWGLVFGHQPKAFNIEGRVAEAEGGHLIKIDTGMAPEAGSHTGQILVFEHPEDMAAQGPPRLHAVGIDGHAVVVGP